MFCLHGISQNKPIAVEQLISKKQYQQLFPHQDTLYNYQNFIEASKSFPLFVNEGTLLQNKQELIAFTKVSSFLIR